MFETAEVGKAVSKAEYKDAVKTLRPALLDAQTRLAAVDASVVVLINGAEGAGKEDTVDLLMAWLDARGVSTHVFAPGGAHDRRRDDRPEAWPFWHALPPYGKLAMYFGSWYTAPIVDRALEQIDEAEYERRLKRIVGFEHMLHAEHVTLVKLWLHLAKDVQRKRLKELKADPRRRWRVSKKTWEYFDRYDEFRSASERALRETSTGVAPWHIIEATDDRHRELRVARTLLEAIERAVEQAEQRHREARRRKRKPPPLPAPQPINLLNQLDVDVTTPKADYRERLDDLQGKIAKRTRKLADTPRGMLLVFEGPDAAGKGGAIRRVTQAMDARLWQVHGIAAPTDEEAARPYLWRFWRLLPARGRVAIFDRSWYGRVLVERVEGFADPADWRRAYNEINEFEEELNEFGYLIRKFWLHISAEEQLQRFHDRRRTPYKQYKLTEEDWRNREKWDAYVASACDMIEFTSTEHAPWVVVPANDKYTARLRVLDTVQAALKTATRKPT